jgi:hypothetical protein
MTTSELNSKIHETFDLVKLEGRLRACVYHTLPNTGLDQRERGFAIAKQRRQEVATVSYKRTERHLSRGR